MDHKWLASRSSRWNLTQGTRVSAVLTEQVKGFTSERRTGKCRLWFSFQRNRRVFQQNRATLLLMMNPKSSNVFLCFCFKESNGFNSWRSTSWQLFVDSSHCWESAEWMWKPLASGVSVRLEMQPVSVPERPLQDGNVQPGGALALRDETVKYGLCCSCFSAVIKLLTPRHKCVHFY